MSTSPTQSPAQSPAQSPSRAARTGAPTWLYPGLLVALGTLSWIAMNVGPGDLSDAELRPTLLSLRGYRLIAAFLVGSALAVGGVAVQGLFRNPLASPSILGTTAGANLGGQLSILAYQSMLGAGAAVTLVPQVLLPIGCLLGALLALGILLLVTRRNDDLVVVLLTGFILSALFLAMGNFAMSMAQDTWELGRAMVSFVLGGLGGTGVDAIVMALPLIVAGLGAVWLWGRPLDVMLSGEDEASALGVDVPAVRLWTILWTAVLTGAAVSLGGNIGFVGLIVPHGMRTLVGAAHRGLVPAAALGGGVFVVMCDVIARVIPSQSEVPLGVVTGLLGAPLFLYLLLRSWREVQRG